MKHKLWWNRKLRKPYIDCCFQNALHNEICVQHKRLVNHNICCSRRFAVCDSMDCQKIWMDRKSEGCLENKINKIRSILTYNLQFKQQIRTWVLPGITQYKTNKQNFIDGSIILSKHDRCKLKAKTKMKWFLLTIQLYLMLGMDHPFFFYR